MNLPQILIDLLNTGILKMLYFSVNFETSIEKSMEASMLLGRSINTDRARTKNQKLISEYFSKEFIKKTSEEWIEIMQEIGVPVGPINTISDILDEDPHTKAREMVVEVDHPRIGKMKTLGVPMKFSETPGEVKTAAPLLGQHTREILEELDIDKKDFKKLLEEGTIYYE